MNNLEKFRCKREINFVMIEYCQMVFDMLLMRKKTSKEIVDFLEPYYEQLIKEQSSYKQNYDIADCDQELMYKLQLKIVFFHRIINVLKSEVDEQSTITMINTYKYDNIHKIEYFDKKIRDYELVECI